MPITIPMFAMLLPIIFPRIISLCSPAAAMLAANSGVDIGDVDILSIAAGTNLIGKFGIDQVTANANEVVTKTGSLVGLEAGTASIGKLAANSGVDIGDVDVLSLPALAAGTAIIGKVSIDQVTANANEVVTKTGSLVALEAGTAEIGKLAAGTAEIGNVKNSGTFATQATLQTGSAAIGKLTANSGVDIGDVDVTSISAGANLIGDVGISGARTSGGTTLYKNIDVDESEDQIKATAGQVYWIHAMNLSASVVFLKFYNATAASVTVGTTVPDLTFPIPTQGDTNGAGFVLAIPNGIAFGTAITIAATTGVADNDSGAPAANVCIVNLGYA